jgi:hypothetical protein
LKTMALRYFVEVQKVEILIADMKMLNH